jgi:hypothetical protein
MLVYYDGTHLLEYSVSQNPDNTNGEEKQREKLVTKLITLETRKRMWMMRI